jgi:hypothetical protein
MLTVLVATGRRLAASVSVTCLAFVLGSLVVTARADEATSLYRAVVPLKSSAEADRTAAFGEALRIVAVRLSGARDAGSRGDIAAAAAKPERYVQQYAARSNHTLSVGFDPAGIEQLVLEAGLPLWPVERPTTIVLLYTPTIADGQRALLAGESSAGREQIEKIADQRGIRVTWPRSSISVGVASEPQRLSAPESAEDAARAGVLVGIGEGTGFTWRYIGTGGVSTTRRGDAAEGAHLVADTLAAEFAPSSTRDIRRESITVGGVADLGAYAAVTSYLESLSLVRHVDVEQASGSSVRLGVTMRGDRALLSRVIGLSDRLRAASGQDPGATGAAAGQDPDATGAVDFLYAP